jgi:signal transduction histidine kinase
MPGMTGVEFLSAVHELDESTIRILVTAYGDVATLETAINSGSIHRFVPKPWAPEDMRATLRNGIERFALTRERAEMLRTREQIVRADRLETLGTLAAGLAHEINNPLVSIHTFMSMAPSKRAEADSEFWGSYHELACQEVDRIRQLVDTMRRFGRGSGSKGKDGDPWVAVDTGSLLREVVRLIDREAGKAEVTLCVDEAPDVPKIVAIRDHIQQIFMNILVNAIHASEKGGKVQVRIFPDASGGAVCFEVTDAGCGISDEDLERIFDPFFTTKGPGQGTGLGLMICHQLVTDHQGEIEVTRTPDSRSRFLVRLPTNPSR